MNGIKSNQLFTILLCVRTFSVICTSDPANSCQMAGAVISAAVQLLTVLPMLRLRSKNSFTLMSEPLFSAPVKILYIVFLIVWGASSLSSLWEVSKSVYFPIESSLMGGLILAGVCVYTASLGLKAAARASFFITGLILLSLLMIMLGALPQAQLSNFVPDAHIGNVLRCAVKDYLDSGELVLCFLLLEFTKGNAGRSIKGFLLAKLLLVECISVIEITVLGKIMDISHFPFFKAGAFSQPFSIQRADSLYMLLFTMLCVLTATVQIVLASKLLGAILPKIRFKSLLIAVLMICVSGGIMITGIDLTPITGVITLVLAGVFPLVLLIRHRRAQ